MLFAVIGLTEAFGGPAAPDRLAHLVRQVFAADGDLVRSLGLDHRAGQAMMAGAVAEAWAEDRALLVEAGTGVGKSLAYLIPALIRAHLTKRPAVVSTHTIALQEQIQQKDLELVRHLFREVPELAPWAGFSTALLVGRGNYLCPQRLGQAIAQRAELFTSTTGDDLVRLADWAAQTKTGLRHELSPAVDSEVWEWVNADSASCSRRSCRPENCFFQAARARLREAKLVIVNHSLLFALLGAGAGPGGKVKGVLLPEDFLVLDEAHTVPEVATEHLGLAVSSFGLDRLLKRLYHPARRRGLLLKLGTSYDVAVCEEARQGVAQFFDTVRARHLQARDVVRLRQPDWGPSEVLPPLRALAERLAGLAERLPDGGPKDELTDFRDRVRSGAAGLQEALTLADEQQVYWLEEIGKRAPILHVRSAPIEIADHLRERLFGRRTAVVMTSATLGPGGQDLTPFARSVGAPLDHLLSAPSPFDYDRQMRVFVATDAPELNRENRQQDRLYLTDMTAYCAAACPGGTLALFTSHADLRAVADALEADWKAAGRTLLVQGRDYSRTELVKQFAAAGNGLLLGTDSFWTGIDVPGPALSQVIIARLPFDNPSHPVAEAKAERLRDAGRSPFSELALPAAVTKFRQGIGRLIRQLGDYGTVTVLDSRIVQKPYGRHFLAALPTAEVRRFSQADRGTVFRPLSAPADRTGRRSEPEADPRS